MAVPDLVLNIEHFTFAVNGVAERLRVLAFEAEERLSQPFIVHLTLAAEDAELDFSTVVGKAGVLSVYNPDTSEARHLNGVVSRFEQAGHGRRFTTYRAELVPQLSLLACRHNNRIFQELSVPDIIRQVLNDASIPADHYQLALQGSYAPREYCVQYRESDLNFISRLMEDEGIFYYFAHTEDNHVMVIADGASVHDPISGTDTVIYHEPSSQVDEEDYIYQFNYAECVTFGAVAFTDFNFKKPSLNLMTSTQAEWDTDLEFYDYPGGFQLPEAGEQRVGVHLEALQVPRKVGNGTATVRRFVPGYRFTLAQHPREDFNRQYLLTAVTQSGSQPGTLEEGAGTRANRYQCEFACMPADMPFRPARSARRRVVEGLQTAIVVGPSGEEIYTDEYGRVKVRFHWDRLGQGDEHSSCWVRVSQLAAGGNWGAVFLPRVGQEVIVDFIEGNPDRPLITGRVYHGTNRPPYPLPGAKTKSTIRSHTSPEDGTYNELLIEDKQGETQVMLSNAYGHKITEDEQTQSLTIETRDQHVIKLDDQNKQVLVTTTNGHSLVLDDTDNANEGTVSLNSTTGYRIVLDDKNKKMVAQTKDGHIFTLDDENKKVELTTTNGHSAVFDDENEAIGITSSKGHYITIDDSADSITLEDSSGAHRFKIDIGGSTLLISTDSGSIDLEAPSGTIALKAANVELEAQADCKLAGLNITAEAGLEYKASGTMVTAEASGIHTISGSLVKIN